ncbi:TetR/AcrR family transcriptional regulator [Streptomyces lavendulae]|uniref:TetR/AcrR family transcriptional regulator n=1 Tax=Streptomyces lavendulae TaxID=1914 RepID=UPI0024A38282|nr:TetR/AcrR family transcriptional regulator [Streptomyces lavendulae]GLX23507.1 TetR family transcriptional regulator [Streptomyces lavendulae subsp. lavendulae]GLX31444.1 TetR family transcriptional regulator [Streptomyces lavendulae subsp. lavendulae]
MTDAQDAAAGRRRHRVREEALADAMRISRRLLVEEGPGAVSVRAVAREMGLTAPGLYRYYAGHRELVQALVSHLYEELAAALAGARERWPADEPGQRLGEVCRELRRWALAHPQEFALLFAKPVADADTAPGAPAHDPSWRFGGVVLDLMVQLWRRGGVQAPTDLDPVWAAQLEEVREHLAGEPVPLEVIYVFVACWARLYGSVAVEVFGHLDFALTDPGPLFDRTVGEVLALLGTPPA